MKVIEKTEIKPEFQMGDIVVYDDYKCMVVLNEGEIYPFELVCLEGTKAGTVINAYSNLVALKDACTSLLIKNKNVVIYSGEGE